MKKIIILLLSATLLCFTLISCKDDSESVKEYVNKLNAEADEKLIQLNKDGIDVEFSSKGTKLTITLLPSELVLNSTPVENYSSLISDLSSMIPRETLERECPEITSVILEVKNADGETVFSEEIK